MLADGMTSEEIVGQFPDLQRDDIRASLAYAAAHIAGSTIIAA